MKLTEQESKRIRRIAASFVMSPLKDSILAGERDSSLAVQTVVAGFKAGKRSAKP
jgi:hypothetical protein